MSQKPKLLKEEVQVKEQVSEAGVCRLQIRWSCKSHRKTSVLESISNKAAGLKVCNSIKKRLQHSCLPVKLAKFLKTPFFTEEFRWLLLTFNSCLHRSSGQKQVWLSAINTRFSWKKYLLLRKSRSSQHSQVFCKRRYATTVTDFFRWILRNFYQHLFWKTSVNRCFWKSGLSNKFTERRYFLLNFIILLVKGFSI